MGALVVSYGRSSSYTSSSQSMSDNSGGALFIECLPHKPQVRVHTSVLMLKPKNTIEEDPYYDIVV